MAADLLTKCLRFNFLDYYNIMSAIRKNPSIQQSVVMSDTFRKEVAERLKIKKPGVSRMLTIASEEPKPEQDLYFCGVARKYFNMQKVEGQGRLKLLKQNDVGSTMAEELIQWAFESKIQDISAQEVKASAYQLQYQT